MNLTKGFSQHVAARCTSPRAISGTHCRGACARLQPVEHIARACAWAFASRRIDSRLGRTMHKPDRKGGRYPERAAALSLQGTPVLFQPVEHIAVTYVRAFASCRIDSRSGRAMQRPDRKGGRYPDRAAARAHCNERRSCSNQLRDRMGRANLPSLVSPPS